MKNALALLIALVSSLSVAYADSPAAPLLTKINPASGMMVNPVWTKIEIYTNGVVLLTTTETKRGSTESTVNFKKIYDIKNMDEINRCVSEIEKSGEFKPSESTCQDDPGSEYYGLYGKKRFARRLCGKTEYLNVSCVPEMLRLLNALDTVSRY